MGMYDSLRLDCPKCGGRSEVQSKAGPCELRKFRLDTAPLSVIADVQERGDRGEIKCNRCSLKMSLQVQRVVQVMERIRYKDDDDPAEPVEYPLKITRERMQLMEAALVAARGAVDGSRILTAEEQREVEALIDDALLDRS